MSDDRQGGRNVWKFTGRRGTLWIGAAFGGVILMGLISGTSERHHAMERSHEMEDEASQPSSEKRAALVHRTRNRAFDMAPPTITHPASGLTDASCLACHETGFGMGPQLASRMSHVMHSNCTQCHVEEDRSDLPWKTEPPANAFQGVIRAGPGDRPTIGAPPMIPHTTWMRSDCLSCHGPISQEGLRTTHPYLTNCQQCHVASAQLDQLDFSAREARPFSGVKPASP